MAEIVMNMVIDKLGPLLVEEVKLLKDVCKEIEEIKRELECMQSFLKDADARAAAEEEGLIGNAGVKTWVKHVREEAYRIEDVIDEYVVNLAQHPHQYGYYGLFDKPLNLTKKLKLRHDIAKEIQDIKSSILQIKQRSEAYNFHSTESSMRNIIPSDPRDYSLAIEEGEVVGIESKRDELRDCLVYGASKRTVISLVGMGGLGKTTLAKKVFDNQGVKEHFKYRAWITVGKAYIKEDLLRTMIKKLYESDASHTNKNMKSAPVGIDTMDQQSLIDKLKEDFKDETYMVVFDDVWNTDFWADVGCVLPDYEQGSRVMLTTRSMEVAKFCNSCVHKLEPLPRDKAWELFCRKAFQGDLKGSCPRELETLSHGILEKCKGLPLAIVTIAGLLSTKDKVASEWKILLKSLGSEFGRDPSLRSFNRVLSESYHDLPYDLKPCFLYFGLFPEDYSISCRRLIRLWIAEGFVKEERGLSLEQAAEKYLKQLISRSLVQVSEEDYIGKPRSCRVHDLIREIILIKTKEMEFCQLLEEDSNLNGQPRRISIYRSTNNVPENINNSKFRSLFLFEVDQVPESSITTLFANFKLLKVLDLEDAPLDYLPKAVGNLLQLRYLSIRNTKVKELPKSIGNLRYLQTLNLKQSLVDELPVEINELEKLRHVLAYRFDDKNFNPDSRKGIKIHEGFGCSRDLQSLCYVDASFKEGQIGELRKFKKLRRLGIVKLTNRNWKELCACFDTLENLESLDVISINGDEILDVESMASPPPLLQRLYLTMRLQNLPDWISKLENLIRLGLTSSKLTSDPLNVLQALPNLLELALFDAYSGEQLHFKGGFPKLRFLQLQKFKELKSLIIDQGALPVLEELSIGPSPLSEIPTGLEHLRNLKRLYFLGMVNEFRDGRLANVDLGKLEHIPTCRVDFYPLSFFLQVKKKAKMESQSAQQS